ncbi:hypothetical protein ACET9H_11350 [Aeromonas media]|uniref:T3SS (YopN, CesT) and YbjN peptide-binding chaperone 1 n=1 Tax=Aeromonas media TaxID=651 RepID=UPI0038D23766
MGNDNTEHVLPQRQCADRRVSKDWAPFGQNLSQVLTRLEEDQFLILSAKRGHRFLQFSCQGAWGTRIEVVSNQFLKGEDRLTQQEMEWLRTHGWNAPTDTPKQSTPGNDPDGSPNYYIDAPASVSAADIVSLVIDTLIHGLGLPYPGALYYESFDSEGGALAFKELGLKPSVRAEAPLMDQVLSVLRGVTGIKDLAFDEDGDLSVCYGAIVIFLVQVDNMVRLLSGLVVEVAETPALLHKLNQINDGLHRIRVILHDDVVYAVLDIPAAPFVPSHLVTAMNEFSEVAEGLAIVLRAEFAGKVVIESAGPGSSLQ